MIAQVLACVGIALIGFGITIGQPQIAYAVGLLAGVAMVAASTYLAQGRKP